MKKYNTIVFKYQRHPDGRTKSFSVALKDRTVMIDSERLEKLHIVSLTKSEMQQLCQAVEECHPEKWNAYYGRPAYNGISWRVELAYHGALVCCSKGFNAFPGKWYALYKIFQKFL